MRTFTFAAITLAGAVLVGCGVQLPVTAQPDLPSLVQRVVDEQNEFAIQRNPLFGAAKGVVRDSLDTLDGCWGAYQPSDVAAPAGPLLTLYSVLIFDTASRSVTDYEYEVSSPAIVNVLSRTIGTFTVADQTHMTWQTVSHAGSDPETGALVVDSDGVTYEPTLVMATLDGDSLKIWLPDADGNYSEDNVFIMNRMSCDP